GHRMPGMSQMLLLDHVGAKSQVKRTSPLIYGEDGSNVVIVASKGGYPQNPGWYYNLRANPDTTVQIGRERRAVHARLAELGERSRLWDMMVSIYGGYRAYQERTEREIPIVVLEPR
ncbi:MAG: nitroreductase family deazaflavin-dependent oxidoreductase, partial [Solirubrobacteraceae bacterium]